MSDTLTTAQAHLGNGKLFTVTPGVINDAAETLYTNGQCLALARAIHDENPDFRIALQLSRPGWVDWAEQMHYTYLSDEHLEDDSWVLWFVHVFNRTPYGDLLDITGEFDVEAFEENTCNSHGATALVWATPAHLDMIQAHPATVVQDVELARTFAKTLLVNY